MDLKKEVSLLGLSKTCKTYAASPAGRGLIVLPLFPEIEKCHERGITEIWIKLQMAEVRSNSANPRNLRARSQAVGKIARDDEAAMVSVTSTSRALCHADRLMAETRVEKFFITPSGARATNHAVAG